MSLTQVAPTEPGVTREPNDKRARRRKPLPGRLRRLSQELAQAEEDSRLEEKENADDHERVRAIFNTCYGGGWSKFLSSSPMLSESDRDFLRDLKYI